MAVLLDLVLLLIVGITVFRAIKKGLVKTVVDACSLIISAVLAIVFSPVFKDMLNFKGEHSVAATYLVIFIISWIIVKIVSILLDKIISALPIIRTVNTLGGFVLGTLLAIFRVSLYCISVGGILALGEKYGIEFLNKVSLNDTILLKYFYEYNPIYILINFILK